MPRQPIPPGTADPALLSAPRGIPRALPDFALETAARAAGHRWIVGVDEVGRGPLAGPVTAAAVWLDPGCIPTGLNDSKQLGRDRRAELEKAILDCAVVSVAHASVEEIAEMNILRASHLAMLRAIAGLPMRPDIALIDGNQMPRGLPCAADLIVGGDALCLSIAAASIVAKVARDRLMEDLAQQHPGYGWERNAGYGTAEHLAALTRLGITACHRQSFKPVHKMLFQEISLSN